MQVELVGIQPVALENSFERLEPRRDTFGTVASQQSLHEGLECCQFAANFYMWAVAIMGLCSLISVKLLFGDVVFFSGVFMKRMFALAAMSALVCAPAFANLDMAKKNACMACHAIDKKLVGPSYQDVAKKYAGQKDAAATLAKSIKSGGSGKWGPVPMPAQAALSEADALALASWIMAGAK